MESIEKHIEKDRKIAEDPLANPAARRHAKVELEELETYFGQLAYIGKYINDNLNPDPRIEVPMRLLSQFGLSYATLDDKYADTISDRVETILADPPAGDEEE